MKTTFLSVLVAMTLSKTAQAEIRIGLDQNRVIFRCEPNYTTSNRPMMVTVSEDRKSKTTEVVVTRYYLNQAFVNTYTVNQETSDRMGAPTSFVGPGIRLTMNFTTTPLQDGGHYSTLQLQSKNPKRYTIEKLSCQTNYHTM